MDKVPTKEVTTKPKRPTPIRPNQSRIGTKPPTAASCSTCVESRSRSNSNRSPEPRTFAPSNSNSNHGSNRNDDDTSYIETETTSQENASDTSCSFNSRDSCRLSRRVCSLSPIRYVFFVVLIFFLARWLENFF